MELKHKKKNTMILKLTQKPNVPKSVQHFFKEKVFIFILF